MFTHQQRGFLNFFQYYFSVVTCLVSLKVTLIVDLSWDPSAKTFINQGIISLPGMHTYHLLVSERYFLKTDSSPLRVSYFIMLLSWKNSRIHDIIDQVSNICKAQLCTRHYRFLIYAMWVNKRATRIKQCVLNRCSHSVSQSCFIVAWSGLRSRLSQYSVYQDLFGSPWILWWYYQLARWLKVV